MITDAVVIGAGISGAAAAYELATAGLSTGLIAATAQAQQVGLPLGPFALAQFGRWNAPCTASSAGLHR